jgi:hypothetical protein
MEIQKMVHSDGRSITVVTKRLRCVFVGDRRRWPREVNRLFRRVNAGAKRGIKSLMFL